MARTDARRAESTRSDYSALHSSLRASSPRSLRLTPLNCWALAAPQALRAPSRSPAPHGPARQPGTRPRPAPAPPRAPARGRRRRGTVALSGPREVALHAPSCSFLHADPAVSLPRAPSCTLGCDWKSCVLARVPWVRIPSAPPRFVTRVLCAAPLAQESVVLLAGARRRARR
jgi:hypothetical protein